MVLGEKTSLAFREVAVIPELGRLYALSVAPIADRFGLLLPKCKRVTLSECALHRHYDHLMAFKPLCMLKYTL